MPQKKDFSIISVNEDDAEEIVIHAGLVSEQSDDPVDVSEGEENPFAETGFEEQQETARSQNESLKTTMEDLKESGPFPVTRLVILIGGLLLIVILIVFFQLMR